MSRARLVQFIFTIEYSHIPYVNDGVTDGVYSLKRLMPVPSRPHLRFFLFFVINVLIVLGGGQDCR